MDCFNDMVFQEVGDLVDQFLKPLGEEWKRAQCFDSVFGVACDPAPSGYRYDFTGRIPCPICGSSNVSYGPDDLPQVEILDLAPVTHNAWQQLSYEDKQEQLQEALWKAGCLP